MAPSTNLSEADFEAIRAVLMATDRGRRFLEEIARRRRAEDVARLFAAADQIEAHARSGEAERARRAQDAERAAEILRQLADVLKDLRPLADARMRARTLEARSAETARTPAKSSGLERRFAALVELDEQDAETGLKLFG